MARLDNLLDGGKGSLGNLVLYRMNGKNYVRMKPKRYRDSKSPAQLAQRQRLQVTNNFLRPFRNMIRITFAAGAAGRSALQAAQSYNMRNALAGEYPGIYVDKSKALLSFGPLPLPVSATVTAGTEGWLIEWENGAEAKGSRACDNLVVMALSADTGDAAFCFTGTCRSEGRHIWKPDPRQGDYHVWIAFRNLQQTQMSNSMQVPRKVTG